MSDWKRILGTVAPWIGAAAAGGVPALVGMAANEVSQAFGKEVRPTVDAIAQAISGATPEQMMALKQADNDFAAKMQQLGFEHIQTLEKVAADDRANARAMHTSVRDLSTPVLSYFVVTAFFWVIYLLLTRQIDVSESMRDVVMIMIGTLSASFTQVMNFRFGTSAGSKDKNEILKRMGEKQ